MAIYDSQTQSKSNRNSRRFRDIDLDFSRNAVTNDVNIVEDVIAVKRALRNLVQTNFYERPFHPEIGSSVRALLFENVTPLNAILLEDRIREVIINFEERALITNVRVIDEADRNGYRVVINFQVLNSVENVSITEFLQRLR